MRMMGVQSMTINRLHNQRIMIVDDDEDILASIDLALRTEGAITQTVTDGNTAVTMARSEFDAVVLDMMLPKRSGFLVLEKLKGLEPPPIVVMITANLGKRHMRYAQELGVDSYLTKPIPLQQLIDTLVELLALKDDSNSPPTDP